MSTYTKYRDTAIGTTKTRLLKRITHRLRKVIYAELCETRTDHKACWIEAGKSARLQVQKKTPNK